MGMVAASPGTRIVLPPGAGVVGVGPKWCVATYRNLMLLHVAGPIGLDFIEATLSGHHAALACDRNGYGVILVCSPGTKIPGSDVRERALVLRKQTQHMLRAQSVVFGGEGFFTAAMRGFITHIASVAQSRVPMSMVGTDVEAVDFVVKRACSASTRPEAVLEVLRAVPGGYEP